MKLDSLTHVPYRALRRTYWKNWENYRIEFDIEILQKKGWIPTGPNASSGGWEILFAKTVGEKLEEIYTDIRYDGTEGKLEFKQNTQNGTHTIDIKFEDFELNKKYHVKATNSWVDFDGQTSYYLNSFYDDGVPWKMRNRLKSPHTVFFIKYHLEDMSIFKMTNFEVRVK